MENRLRLGVRELVEFCCRSGDLGGGDGPAVAALDGLYTHQKIQQKYRGQAQAEYAIRLELEVDEYVVELGGRIDLLFADESPPRLEEIKTVQAASPAALDDTLYWAQLACYGSLYAREQTLERLTLCLNLVELYSRRERRRTRTFSRDELDRQLEDILRHYLRWHRQVLAQRDKTIAGARDLEFPFAAFRDQQRRFAAEVYRAIREQRSLMVEAPTGSGKTVSTLFPAIKAIGEDLCDQVVYLSAKRSGQQQAVATIELMPADLAYVVIQAKARSCPCYSDDSEIDSEGRCRRCVGFFDRLPAAREALFGLRRLDTARLQATAAAHRLCPFELGLQMMPWVDIIVCDFNYVFDPLVQLGYFKNDQRRRVLLIDELHNLVDRARGMYSASLVRTQIRQAANADNNPSISRALGSLQRALDRELRDQQTDEAIAAAAPERLMQACRRFIEKLGADIFANRQVSGEALETSRAALRFRTVGQLFSRHHRALGYRPVAGRELKLLCLNAHEYLRDCYPLFTAVCGFSATLSPPDYFREALGFDENCRKLRLEPVFPAQHLGVYIGDYVDTRYRERDRYVDAIADTIARCYRARPGNYLVFFSAYAFLQRVQERFAMRHPGIDCIVQRRDDDETAQQQFVAQFFEHSPRLGFAILGGRFAEGIDYRGDALIGAIIVGVGLPQAGTEQQLIRQDFDSIGLDGFDYAFRYPGLTRVMQSAGRVIRDEQDRGVIVLLDKRFRQPGYARHLPPHWHAVICNRAESLEQSLAEFWNGSENGVDGTDRNSKD